MENVRKRCSVEIVNNSDKKKLERLIAKPNYKSSFIFENSNLASVRMGKTTVKFNKPVYLGQTILDVSKTLMYDFHYSYVKPKYGDKARLLFTNMDSLCNEVETEDFYRDISPDVEKLFDTSNFSKNHPSGISTGKNKKVIGLFKDENGGQPISEFCGLRSKCYATKMHEGSESRKCKGVKKTVVKTILSIEDYKRCLFENETQLTSFNTLRSRKHEITTETITKISLSPNDDKRYVIPGETQTLAFGHRKLR